MTKFLATIMILSMLFLSSCAVIKYTSDGQEIKDKQRIFYVIAGLAPITDNTVKAGEEYEVTHDFIDFLIIGISLGIIYSRSVIVK